MLMFLHWHRYQILLQSKLLVTALIMWVMRGQRQTTLQWNVLGEHVWFEDREENNWTNYSKNNFKGNTYFQNCFQENKTY